MGPRDLKLDTHALRKAIDSVINQAKDLANNEEVGGIGRGPGGREVSLVITKLQEAKMWAGKILEELGSELPKEYRDEAIKTSSGNTCSPATE